ncbi:hypothetical protein DL766_004426 [Monosporascus sp. MC13-8B]|uniref:Uncharacterized protein n=1 Tax=Monosporascus cannonballus TaxID=155416 RepID=A0ABY0HAN7_9PEZI|nr:hypothetical protein DL762_003620 [Monosporascus cannonballus]RYO98696.1 hypothetical protein DL763_001957 [Monosporascus cannonballus]RYP31373.1 hypothetical protein DL766_004426 [Monosporascus sp. MC13-8B]
MLSRQLQRPLSRTVVASAAWPRWTVPIASARKKKLHGGSGNSGQNDDEQPVPDAPHLQDQQQQQQQQREPKKEKISLYEELFPDERHARRPLDDTSYSRWASQLLEEPPRILDVPEGGIAGIAADLGPDPAATTPNDAAAAAFPAPAVPRARCMLVLSAASKNLMESDFLRLGVKGQHVEGWVSGIVKVIQARDPDTLEPLGYYYILFDSRASAAAYSDEVHRLWRLAKAQAPAAQHNRRRSRSARNGADDVVIADNDADTARALLRSFTLVLPTQRRHLEQRDYHAWSREFRRAWLRGAAPGGASWADILAPRCVPGGSPSLVLLSAADGQGGGGSGHDTGSGRALLSVDALRRAIEDDGAERGLAWRVLMGDPQTGERGGIMPFGRSYVRQYDRLHDSPAGGDGVRGVDGERGSGCGEEDADDALTGTGTTTATGGDGSDGNAEGALSSSPPSEEEEEDGDGKHRRYSRFVIPFADDAEARRFVRCWHRRELRVRMGAGRHGGWEESVVVNTTVLW